MRKYLSLIAVALLSSTFSFFIFQKFASRKVVWNDSDGEAQYTGLVDRLLDSRSSHEFHSSSPTDFIIAADVSAPAVANIRALQENDGGIWGGGSLTGSSGSAVIVSPDGYVVTNHHVVENSTDIKVTLYDKREYKAKIVGSDPSTDISLLKIEESGLPFVVFGNSDSVRVGEWVLAVGNPFNLESTVTAGIVSAKGRNINILGGGSSIESFIQTDAVVNPGNSGGALVNTAGELIGINTAIVTESGSYEGYSFAVPSNLVQKVVRDLREFGQVQRAFLGVGIQDLDNDLAQELGFPTVEGVLVNRVNANGGADDAGLREQDVIIGLNGNRIRSTPELQEFVGRFRPGEQVLVEYWRDGKKFKSKVVLKDINNAIAAQRVRGDELQKSLGLELRDLGKEEKRRLKLSGCVVASVRRGSVVFDTNLQPGFVITTVNGKRVASVSETIEAIQAARNLVSLDGYYEGESDLYSYRFKKK